MYTTKFQINLQGITQYWQSYSFFNSLLDCPIGCLIWPARYHVSFKSRSCGYPGKYRLLFYIQYIHTAQRKSLEHSLLLLVILFILDSRASILPRVNLIFFKNVIQNTILKKRTKEKSIKFSPQKKLKMCKCLLCITHFIAVIPE